MLARLGFPYAGAGGPVWGWELKNSYFRPFFVKIRSFSTFGALNPPKCPNKPKKTIAHFFCVNRKRKKIAHMASFNIAPTRGRGVFVILLNYKALKLAIENIMLYLRYLFL